MLPRGCLEEHGASSAMSTNAAQIACGESDIRGKMDESLPPSLLKATKSGSRDPIAPPPGCHYDF